MDTEFGTSEAWLKLDLEQSVTRKKFGSPDWANFYFLKCRRGAAAMLELQEKKFYLYITE